MTFSTQLSQEQVDEFVVASHHDFDKVKEMLAEKPALLDENATWMETPIQAAAHVGNRPIAEYLLEQGAPLDICTAAMLGLEAEVAGLDTAYDAQAEELTEILVKPKAADVHVLLFGLLWHQRQ